MLFLEELKRQSDFLKMGMADANQVKIEAPSAMESWSDTTRSQKESEIAQYVSKIKESEEAFVYLSSLKNRNPENKIGLADIFSAKDLSSGEISYYLIAEKGGGLILKEPRAFVISSTTPIANVFLSKKVGDRFEISGKEKEIVEIF